MTPVQMLEKLNHISEIWRSETSAEQRMDLRDLDRLLGWLDGMDDADTTAAAERIDELRGRIEILMDEIHISLGIEPPAILTPEDVDPAPAGEEL